MNGVRGLCLWVFFGVFVGGLSGVIKLRGADLGDLSITLETISRSGWEGKPDHQGC